MARTLPLHPHLPAEDLSRRARRAPNLVEARRWQLLALVADGKTVTDAAALVGLYPPDARRVVQRDNAEGPDAIRDRRLAAQLVGRIEEIRAAHPDAEVQLWATDEHRIGLLPLIRRVWAPIGKRPSAPVPQRYEWLSVCGVVRPTTGETEWWLLPTVTAVVFGQMLAAFARDVGVGPTKRIILALDGAGWHTGEQVQVSEGIQLRFLPSYSPELQPAEHLWPLTNEPLANRRFESLPALEAVQAERCLVLQQQPDLIQRHTLFRWWPTDV